MSNNVEELALLIMKQWPDALVQLQTFDRSAVGYAGRYPLPDALTKLDLVGFIEAELSVRVGSKLLVIEHIKEEGYGLSKIDSDAEGFMRGYDLFTPSFAEVEAVLWQWLQANSSIIGK